VLTDEEIASFWAALDRSSMTLTVRAGLRFLLLIPVRSGELLRARWEEFDLAAGVWTVPAEHLKLGRREQAGAQPWKVPLPRQALAQLERLRVFSEGSSFVMASALAEGGAISEKALGHAMRRLFLGERPLLSFAEPRPTVHDLRRTCRTGLARLGVSRDVAERCLGHVLGEIEATYNVHDFFDERGEALVRWGAHVDGLVKKTSNVVSFAASGPLR
jgi:integrase